MGYYEEKKQYERERALAVHNLIKENEKRNFCNCCGKKLTEKNLKGKCVDCGGLVCEDCSKLVNKRITCVDCWKEDEGNWECDKCGKDLYLNEKEIKELNKKGMVKTKCPHCKKIQVCEYSDEYIDEIKKDRLEEGVIPIWVVIIGFLFYILPGVILFVIRNNQIERNKIKYRIH